MKINFFDIQTIFLVFLAATFAHGEISRECKDNQECLIELPGTLCADGTTSYLTVTKRPYAKNLLVYLHGGGACWNKQTCDDGYASPLTREERGNNWNRGEGIQDGTDPDNVFAKDFNIVTVPYCTGDAYTGNRNADYTDSEGTLRIQHQGYSNVQLALDKAKDLFPSPQKAVFYGCSAGALGVSFHLQNFRARFMNAEKYVVSDAGTPFKPPHLDKAKFDGVMAAWGADQTIKSISPDPTHPLEHFGDIFRHQTQAFKDVQFGFISSYADPVMSFFAYSVGAPNPLSAVFDMITDVATNDIGSQSANAKVFYSTSTRHCHSFEKLSDVTSLDWDLGRWLKTMVQNDPTWTNVRPDLVGPVMTAEDLNPNEQIHSPAQIFGPRRP